MTRQHLKFQCAVVVATTTLISSCAVQRTPSAMQADARPNILFVLADDLGISDLGAFGSEIKTPNLDRIAMRGIRLTSFAAHATCSPSRATMLTGVDSHLAGFGTMRGDATPEQVGKPGYEGFLNQRVVTVAQLLKDGGYHTYISGKWDMGVKDEHTPDKYGFDRSYVLLQGSADHFDEVGAMAEAPVPFYREDGKPASLPDDFYSSKDYTDKLISFIDRNRGDGKPFFAYLAYTAPHYPLQAPDDYIAKYAGVYDAGYDAIFNARVARMREMRIVPPNAQPAAPDKAWPAWSDLPPEMRALEAKRMQIYAAMIEAMDYHFGRLIRHLESTGQADNTLIVFLSDNGPDGSNPLDWGWFDWADKTFNLDVDNMGRPNSYVWAGPNWARVSAAPYRLAKFFTTEGGIRVPAFVYHPKLASGGRVIPAFANLFDITPTLLDLAGIAHPGAQYAGRSVYVPTKGKSLLPLLAGEVTEVHAATDTFAWEIFNRRAVRTGDWKILWMNKPWGKGLGEWSLHNLARDPAEQIDMAEQEPRILSDLTQKWDAYVRENGVVPAPEQEVPATNRYSHFQWLPPELRKP